MRRAFTLIEVLIVVGLLGGGFVAWKTGLMPGSTKRAKTSTATTAALLQANDNQGAAAAASVVKIGGCASSRISGPYAGPLGRWSPRVFRPQTFG